MTAAPPLSDSLIAARQAAQRARQALQRGDSAAARREAALAARLAPDLEDAWLLLAAVASPHASLAYLRRALEINPASPRARAGMHWALERERKERRLTARQAAAAPTVLLPLPAARRRPSSFVGGLAALLLVSLMIAAGLWRQGQLGDLWQGLRRVPQAAGLFLTATPSASATSTPTTPPTPTPTATSSPTLTPTATSAPTDTPTPAPTATNPPPPSPTFTPAPSPTPRPTKPPKPIQRNGPEPRPASVGPDERWIDVDLSAQTTYAMQGDTIVKSFVVSTGRWPNVTVTGVYRIYVKYESTLMYGDDYYLPNVPYVMYFYEGYGLHGTYWHNNFGHPMSHGCVNLRTDEAGWLFDFASVGTTVSVHQ